MEAVKRLKNYNSQWKEEQWQYFKNIIKKQTQENAMEVLLGSVQKVHEMPQDFSVFV